MKKLLFVFAIAVFAACNSGSETPAATDTAAKAPVEAPAADTSAPAPADTTAAPAPAAK